MGLDQYAGLRDSNGEVHEKFYWRKHARLQQFFSKEFEKQKGASDENSYNLGFNGGEGGVKITEDIVKRLEEQYKKDYYNCFAPDGFFWGQQFQEDSVKDYKEQDIKFLKFCQQAISEGKVVEYWCSW